ncbi:uncharacterized protein LOC124437855 [Xenia sp. Carnegie-2017]|uniref:uncharacterized protein LOC124437855 n=1 Tax=Xenia sp. Carnegie-2017 TaxID=2897299 RepID=UPI001F035ABF|nr:uncharacterized protein LOC124437855 [Xenia sp. Carnegie-2017]
MKNFPLFLCILRMELLKLKNKYRQLQKQAMKDAKQKLKIEFEEKNLECSTAEVPQRKIKDKVNCKIKNDDNDEKKLPEKLERHNGVFLRFKSNENVDSKEVLDIFSTITTVAYLEMK